MDSIDYMVGRMLSALVGAAAGLVGSVVGMVVATKATALLFLLPVLILYYFVAQYIRRAAVEVQRIASVSKSPVYTSFSETLQGLSCVAPCVSRAALACRRHVSDSPTLTTALLPVVAVPCAGA